MGGRGGPAWGRGHRRGSRGGVSGAAWTQRGWSCPGIKIYSAGREEADGVEKANAYSYPFYDPLPALFLLEGPLVGDWAAGGSVEPGRSCKGNIV